MNEIDQETLVRMLGVALYDGNADEVDRILSAYRFDFNTRGWQLTQNGFEMRSLGALRKLIEHGLLAEHYLFELPSEVRAVFSIDYFGSVYNRDRNFDIEPIQVFLELGSLPNAIPYEFRFVTALDIAHYYLDENMKINRLKSIFYPVSPSDPPVHPKAVELLRSYGGKYRHEMNRQDEIENSQMFAALCFPLEELAYYFQFYERNQYAYNKRDSEYITYPVSVAVEAGDSFEQIMARIRLIDSYMDMRDPLAYIQGFLLYEEGQYRIHPSFGKKDLEAILAFLHQEKKDLDWSLRTYRQPQLEVSEVLAQVGIRL